MEVDKEVERADEEANASGLRRMGWTKANTGRLRDMADEGLDKGGQGHE